MLDAILQLEGTLPLQLAGQRRPELRPVTDMLRNLVHASRSKSVRTVVIDGRVVLEEGAFPGLDEAATLDHIDSAAQHLLQKMGVRPTSERVDRGTRRPSSARRLVAERRRL